MPIPQEGDERMEWNEGDVPSFLFTPNCEQQRAFNAPATDAGSYRRERNGVRSCRHDVSHAGVQQRFTSRRHSPNEFEWGNVCTVGKKNRWRT